MGAFFLALYQSAVKYIFLGLVAFAGIMCGIRKRKSKNAKEASQIEKKTEQ